MSPLPCPAYRVLRLLAGKWKPAILFHLRAQILRFGDLRRSLPEVSQKVLTAQLKELESDGVIIRTLYPDVPPRVEYSLSPLGIALLPLLQQMHDFALSHGSLLAQSEAGAAREEPHLGEPG
ncbi:winged helix-turn-helix transcriptional regulator [Aeromonas hydrophila]|uniref:Putative transcriptional regulator n=1 Tax=Aeromonas hydrophila subsp. hydrophila (strain ATCC 7966 / DSM 30187 / BCRC 13018 / CCUG 14551 / JCM 1027 / KCTC 2358 / NCIMB 9240 / NCTC 8049) TaxID=380703 RepID=A0KFG3_AERHH|nr:helix-turn-helix domain-containing protein [Aeromonas hydrophila]ABK37876.1 putative transcriptional regulator [Aeromonas hydrophila subsp. hydrophila ATCC 7966]MBS4673550.1 helix-turn-helix transcriptional regulator [Aeromonas hydrophila]OOD34552.1 transcriptional regulator [Aeromonas hydrophila]SUU15145.1 transcriptional regulator [Aeromonas hydrophila]